MKRWLFAILVLLLIGAVVNVLVAWGCVRFLSATVHSNSLDSAVGSTQSAAQWWQSHRPGDFRTDFQLRYGKTGFGIARTVYVGKSPLPLDFAEYYFEAAVRHRAGWPMLSLQGEKWCTKHHTSVGDLNDRVTIEASLRWGWEADASPGVPIDAFLPLYPLLPIWPGFLVNTVFYAWVVFLIFFALVYWPLNGPRRIRRHLRRKRGHCPMCGYDLRGVPEGGCP